MSYGIIGLGAMGSNLALNISKNHKVHLYNRTRAKIDATVAQGKRGQLHAYDTMLQMTQSMESPRTIISMLPHGEVSFSTFNHISKLLEPGDTLIDCANEHYNQSVTNEKLFNEHQLNYLGAGMSGGAKGALNGPALMVGGNVSVYKKQADFLESFSANCVHMNDSPDSGHFTKMVHNGIEYVMLQAIADVYAYFNYNDDFMNTVLRRCHDESGMLNGYLTQSALAVLNTYDISSVTDIAAMNNTGLWCVEYANQHGISVPTMTSAVQSRTMSKLPKCGKDQRKTTRVDLDAAYHTLQFVFAIAILEGLELVKHKCIDVSKAQKAWSTKTIIECPMIMYSSEKLRQIADSSIFKSRMLLLECIRNGVPVPSVNAAIGYHDFVHQSHTQMSLVMAQRNYFGQHPM